MADHVAVFRLDNKNICCLLFGVKLYFFKTFPRAKGLIKLFITAYKQFQILYSLSIFLYKVNLTPMYTERRRTPIYTGERDMLSIQGKGYVIYTGQTVTYTG